VHRLDRIDAADEVPSQGAGTHFAISAAGEIAQTVPSQLDANGNDIRHIHQLLPSEIAWGLVWGLGVRLEEAAAAAERKGIDRLAPTLEDAALAALQSLRTLHVPLILATAEGRKLQEQADRLHMTRAEQAALRDDAVALSDDLNEVRAL
jgi:hypothetical protein